MEAHSVPRVNSKDSAMIASHTVASITAKFERELSRKSNGKENSKIKSCKIPDKSLVVEGKLTKLCDLQMSYDPKYLFIAAREGNMDVVKWLIKNGADPNLQDGKGRNALLTAACSSRMDIFKYLMDISNINEVDQNGWSIVHIGAVNGQLKLIQEVKDKLSLNLRSRSGLSPLCLAANKGHVDVIDYLLYQGADVKISSNQGWTPLHFAARAKHFPALYSLINSGKCGNLLNHRTVEGQTPLSLATEVGSFDCVRLLLDSGANPSPKDNKGWTPARIAAINNFTEIAQYLTNYGATM